jgi:hypothetical protein
MAERPLPELAAEITAGVVRLAAATAAWLRLVAEFDRREGWTGIGIASCAQWLAWQCGLSPGTAREHVRVARALTGLPKIAAAFAAGRISYAKVRAVTRVADASCEDDLLELALSATASQVERTVRAWRRAESADTESLAARQRFDHWWDDDGMLVVRARLTPDDGAEFLAAVNSLAERDARRNRAAATRARASAPPSASPGPDADCADDVDEIAAARDRATARRCAALTRLASAAADADRRAGDPPRREVVLHVDAGVLADDAAAGRAHLEGGPALSRRQVLRMSCEATAVVLLENGGEPLAHGRRRRRASRAQRRALLSRDGGCARPGCDETRIERLHAHHLRHWLHGGRTDLSNLVLLCDRDHGLAHDLDLIMTRRGGRLIAVTPDGRRVWGAADQAFPDGLLGVAHVPDADEFRRFVGVEPLDSVRGRRPSPEPPHPGQASYEVGASGEDCGSTVSTLLFPAGEPALADAMAVGGERMNLRYVVGVLMTNRDLIRRLAEQNGVAMAA